MELIYTSKQCPKINEANTDRIGDRNSSIIIFGDFNKSLWIIDRTYLIETERIIGEY